MGEAVGHRLRIAQYRRIAKLSWGNIDRLETSDLLVRLTADVNQVRTVVTNSVTTLLRAPLMIIGAFFILLAIDVRLALVMALFLPLTIAVLWFYQSKGAPLYRAVLARFDGLNQVLQENMAGVRVVKAFVRADYENGRFEKENRELQDAATAAQRSAALLNPVLLLIVNLGLAGALWVGGGAVIDKRIELGAVFVLLNYLVAVMIPLVLLSVLLPQMASADSSVERILEVMNDVPDVEDKPGAPALAEAVGGAVRGRVVFENVTFAYLGPDGQPNPNPVLHDIDLVAEPGQIVALLGATGSGKSTLVNLIIRSYEVTSGRVTIDGVDVRDVTHASLLETVTPVLQQPSLFSGTLERNIDFGANHDDPRLRRCRDRGRRRPKPRPSSTIALTVTSVRSSAAARTSRVANVSASRSLALWFVARASSSSTTPPAPSTLPPRRGYRTPSAVSWATPRSSSSRNASARCSPRT